MSTARLTDLIYGHVGEPVYDTKSHKWHFSRTPFITRQIKPLGQPSIILQPSIVHGTSGNLQSAADRTQNIKKLAHTYPELVPGISLLPKLTQDSEIVNEVTSRHDPTASTLLAFGKAMTERPKYTKRRSKLLKVPIAAVVGGSVWEAVRLFRLEEEHLGWGAEENIGLKCFGPTVTEQCWWVGNGSPIQQVCFGGTQSDQTSWLAVRYHGAITILQPLLHSDAVLARPRYSSSSAKVQCSPPSRLDPNPVITMSIQQTGGSPHADVSFNIWDDLQFAIVDFQGRWGIWKLIPPTPHRSDWAVKAGPKGKLAENITDSSNITAFDNDGWGAISWVGDEHTVVIAKRKLLSVFHVEEPPKRLLAPDLNLVQSSDWILDIRRSPFDNTHLFVATSTRIFWLLVTPFNDEQAMENPSPGASILLSWRHFRDERDISLRMSVTNDEKTNMVIVYSSLTNFSTVFTFGLSQSLAGFPQSLSDPYVFPLYSKDNDGNALAEQNDFSGKGLSIVDLDLQSIDYEYRVGSMASGLGSVYQAGGARFFQLNTLYNDMSLCQCLYVGLSATDPMHIETPQTQQLRKPPKPLSRVLMDDFIVPDQYLLDDYEELYLRRFPQLVGNEVVKTQHLPPDEDPRTLDFEWLEKYLRVSSSPSGLDNARSLPGVPFEQCLDLIQSTILDKLAVRSPGIESMIEILDLNIMIHDIDAASRMLRNFIVTINDLSSSHEDDNGAVIDDRVHVSVLFTGQLYNDLQPHSEIIKENVPSQAYDNLMAAWIKPLPRRTSSRVRIAAERNVRKIAAQICLASLGIQISSSFVPNENFDQHTVSEHVDVLNLPLRRKSSFQKRSVQPNDTLLEQSSTPITSSQPSKEIGLKPDSQLPTQTLPTPEMTPSLRSGSSVASLQESEDPASQRLRALVSLTPQPTLPTPISNILRQWSEGADPANFDWEATQQAIDAENQPQGDEKMPKAKKRRRDENRLKRERNNAGASSSQITATTIEAGQQPPVLDTRSYPSSAPGLQSSSQFTGTAIGTSQVESGRYTGRNLESKKGKKKKPGF